MERNEIDDKDVASPGRHHVEIGDGSCCGPHDRACLDRFDPEEIREEKSKYRDSFVVVGAGNRARDVARDDGNKTGCQKTSTSVPDLPCEKKTSNGCQPTEQRQRKRERERERDEREKGEKGVRSPNRPEHGSEEDADVSDVDRKVEGVQEPVDGSRGDHETWVHCSPHNPTKRVPRSLVKPV